MNPIEELTLSTLNKINYNLWIGDYEKIQQITKELMSYPESKKLLEFGEKGIELVKEIRKMALQKTEKKEWFAQNVVEYFKNKDVLFDNYLIGLILQRLQQDYTLFLEISSEEYGKFKELQELLLREKYKFRIINRHPKYETRSIFETKTTSISDEDLLELKTKLSAEHSIQTTKASTVLQLYSKESFIEVTILPYIGWIKTTLRSGGPKNIEKLSDLILEKFSAGGMKRKVSPKIE